MTAPGSINAALHVNMTRKPFDDIRVRQAVRYAIDKEGAGQDLRPMGKPMVGLMAPTYARRRDRGRAAGPGATVRPRPRRKALAGPGSRRVFPSNYMSMSTRGDCPEHAHRPGGNCAKIGDEHGQPLIDHTTYHLNNRKNLNTLVMFSWLSADASADLHRPAWPR